MILIFLGPPGAGKGTQARIFEEESGYRQISTGDILRANVREGTELGTKAKSYMDRGELVPDDIIIGMMEPELERSQNVILDGFPRTVAQAQALDDLIQRRGMSAGAVLFDVLPDVLMERLTGRWTHEPSGRTYHAVHNPPKDQFLDDVTKERLTQREDDKPETIKHRLDVYNRQTTPLVEYYSVPNRITRVDALGSIESVTEKIRQATEVRPGPTGRGR